MMAWRAAAAVRAALQRRWRFNPCTSPGSSAPRNCRPRPRDDGALFGVVGEAGVPNIRASDICAPDVPVASLIPGGVPRLALSVRLDRITPGVLRRLGAIPIDSNLLAKILKPHISDSYKKAMVKLIHEELKLHEASGSVIGRATSWVTFLANVAIVSAAAVVGSIWAYSQMYPVQFRARVDELIDSLAQSVKFSLTRGWLGERLTTRYLRIEAAKNKAAADEKLRKEDQKRRQADGRHRPVLRRLKLFEMIGLGGFAARRDRDRVWATKKCEWDRNMTTLSTRVFWDGRRF